jgi:hypothetical protein
MLLAVAVMVLAQVPVATPSPLKQIGHVRASFICGALRQNLFPAVAGLRLNDELIDKGRMMMQKTSDDAALGATSAQITGGAGAGLEMDAFQLGMLSSELGSNLAKIEALLDDPKAFSNKPASDDELALARARSRLQEVVARQQASLNVLSMTADTNSSDDLRAQRDIIPYEHDMSGPQTPAYVPMSLPDALALTKQLTQDSETRVMPAVAPIADACKPQ